MGTSVEDPITSVTCPECRSEVPMSFPRSAEIVAIATADPTVDIDPERRRKQLRKTCENGHHVAVVYDW